MPVSSQIIVLVGLMGSGKSRIGRELARLLKLPFVDADLEIEKAATYSVSEIFERFGEKEFRRGEREIMARLLSGEAKVLASGGGAFIQPEIRDLVKNKAISVWLKADLETLVKRVSRNNRRPLLQVSNPAERLRQLMEDRYPVYAEADITVVTDHRTPQDMAQLIKSELDRFQQNKG
ncbi:MAG: shikimate kinase [Alphaproteobacteria bacterium]|nr:shikimate kinase [Alphaproteobacteria bacterium]